MTEEALNGLFKKLHERAIEELKKSHEQRDKELEWEHANAEGEADAEEEAMAHEIEEMLDECRG